MINIRQFLYKSWCILCFLIASSDLLGFSFIVWNFSVVSKKRFCINFAKKARIFNSETLKNAIVIKIPAMIMAKIVPTAFDDSWNFVKVTSANAIPIARINNWIIEIVNGPIEKVNPDNNPFLIFFGNTAFILY